jgi:hypothetical protein
MYAAVSFQSGRGVTGFRVPDRGSVPPFMRHGIATLGIRVNVWARTLRALGRTCDQNRALIVGQTRAGLPLFCDALGVVSLFAICKLSATLQGPPLLQAPSLQRATDQHPSAVGLATETGPRYRAESGTCGGILRKLLSRRERATLRYGSTSRMSCVSDCCGCCSHCLHARTSCVLVATDATRSGR